MQEHDCNTIDLERRQALKTGSSLSVLGLFTLLGLVPNAAWAAANRPAFEAKTLGEAFAAMGGLIPKDSTLIKLTVPNTAENGAVVPVTVESMFSRTEQIAILVDKNPTMLAASFMIPEGTEGFITTRIKMAQTASVVALVKSEGKFYKASMEVKVTAGGC